MKRGPGSTARPLVLATLLLAATWFFVEWRSDTLLDATAQPEPVPPLAAAASADLERGRHVGEAIAQCTFCHASDWGGRRVADDAFVGRLYAPNLTPGHGGLPAHYSDEDLARAIRYAQDPQGRNLWLMPSEWFAAISDRDLASLVHYIRSLPPVDREAPARRAGPLTRVVVALGLAPDLVVRPAMTARAQLDPPDGTDPLRHGDYLVGIAICGTCHGHDLRGGRHPLAPLDEPVPPDISASGAVAGWSTAEFLRTMRSGRTPEGRMLDPAFMPWRSYARMSDRELLAIHRRLTHTAATPPAVAAEPPLGVGEARRHVGDGDTLGSFE